MNNFEFLTKNTWTTQKEYDDFVLFLKSLSKNESVEYLERHVKILNTKQNVYALSMVNIRLIAKSIAKGNYLNFLNIAKDDSYEEVTIQGLVIAYLKDLKTQTKLLNNWVCKIDNWSSCDTVVSTMKSLKASPEKAKYFEHYKKMCFDKREFVARFGIVCIMVNYLEPAYINEILNICANVHHDGYYVKMAVAWLISFAFMKFKDKTYTLLSKQCLDKFTQNKAISKCRDSYQVSAQDKANLIAYRIK